MLHRVQVTDISTLTVQKRLCESGLHGQIATKKPLPKDTNKKKRLAWAKKHEQWTLDWWKSVLWSDESKVLHQITWPQTILDSLRWFGPQNEGKAANKCSAYVGTPSRLLEKHTRWSWLRECQECAKLSSRQRVATLKNLKYTLICLLFCLLDDSMCYFIVLMSSLLFNKVEHSKPTFKKKLKYFFLKHVSTFGTVYNIQVNSK